MVATRTKIFTDFTTIYYPSDQLLKKQSTAKFPAILVLTEVDCIRQVLKRVKDGGLEGRQEAI